MRFWTRLAVLFFVTTVLFLGVFLALFALNVVDFGYVISMLGISYDDPQLRLVVGVIAAVILFLNYIFANTISDSHMREKTIAFDNPSGRVSVSLTALEDLVRRLISKESEVKEVKASIKATKKGLDVTARLILKSDGSIPELTSHLQEIVKKKIQTTIGIEDPVTVKVHVAKIIPEELKSKPVKPKTGKETKEETNIPFQGYRP